MKSRILLPAILLAAATSAYAQPSGERDADAADDQEEIDLGGPEAKQMLPVHLQSLIEAVINLSPDLAKARVDRKIAHDTAEYERRNQATGVSLSVEVVLQLQRAGGGGRGARAAGAAAGAPGAGGGAAPTEGGAY